MLFISMGHRAERWVEVANVKSNFRKRSLVGGFCWLNVTKKKFSGGICPLNPPPCAPRGCDGNGTAEATGAGLILQKAAPVFQKAAPRFSKGGSRFSKPAIGFSKPATGFSKGGTENSRPGFGGVRADTEKPFTRRLPPALGPGSRRERFGYCSKAGAAADGATARPQLAGKISGGGSGSSPLRCWDRGCRCFHRLPKWTS